MRDPTSKDLLFTARDYTPTNRYLYSDLDKNTMSVAIAHSLEGTATGWVKRKINDFLGVGEEDQVTPKEAKEVYDLSISGDLPRDKVEFLAGGNFMKNYYESRLAEAKADDSISDADMGRTFMGYLIGGLMDPVLLTAGFGVSAGIGAVYRGVSNSFKLGKMSKALSYMDNINPIKRFAARAGFVGVPEGVANVYFDRIISEEMGYETNELSDSVAFSLGVIFGGAFGNIRGLNKTKTPETPPKKATEIKQPTPQPTPQKTPKKTNQIPFEAATEQDIKVDITDLYDDIYSKTFLSPQYGRSYETLLKNIQYVSAFNGDVLQKFVGTDFADNFVRGVKDDPILWWNNVKGYLEGLDFKKPIKDIKPVNVVESFTPIPRDKTGKILPVFWEQPVGDQVSEMLTEPAIEEVINLFDDNLLKFIDFGERWFRMSEIGKRAAERGSSYSGGVSVYERSFGAYKRFMQGFFSGGDDTLLRSSNLKRGTATTSNLFQILPGGGEGNRFTEVIMGKKNGNFTDFLDYKGWIVKTLIHESAHASGAPLNYPRFQNLKNRRGLEEVFADVFANTVGEHFDLFRVNKGSKDFMDRIRYRYPLSFWEDGEHLVSLENKRFLYETIMEQAIPRIYNFFDRIKEGVSNPISLNNTIKKAKAFFGPESSRAKQTKNAKTVEGLFKWAEQWDK